MSKEEKKSISKSEKKSIFHFIIKHKEVIAGMFMGVFFALAIYSVKTAEKNTEKIFYDIIYTLNEDYIWMSKKYGWWDKTELDGEFDKQLEKRIEKTRISPVFDLKDFNYSLTETMKDFRDKKTTFVYLLDNDKNCYSRKDKIISANGEIVPNTFSKKTNILCKNLYVNEKNEIIINTPVDLFEKKFPKTIKFIANFSFYKGMLEKCNDKYFSNTCESADSQEIYFVFGDENNIPRYILNEKTDAVEIFIQNPKFAKIGNGDQVFNNKEKSFYSMIKIKDSLIKKFNLEKYHVNNYISIPSKNNKDLSLYQYPLVKVFDNKKDLAIKKAKNNQVYFESENFIYLPNAIFNKTTSFPLNVNIKNINTINMQGEVLLSIKKEDIVKWTTAPLNEKVFLTKEKIVVSYCGNGLWRENCFSNKEENNYALASEHNEFKDFNLNGKEFIFIKTAEKEQEKLVLKNDGIKESTDCFINKNCYKDKEDFENKYFFIKSKPFIYKENSQKLSFWVSPDYKQILNKKGEISNLENKNQFNLLNFKTKKAFGHKSTKKMAFFEARQFCQSKGMTLLPIGETSAVNKKDGIEVSLPTWTIDDLASEMQVAWKNNQILLFDNKKELNVLCFLNN